LLTAYIELAQYADDVVAKTSKPHLTHSLTDFKHLGIQKHDGSMSVGLSLGIECLFLISWRCLLLSRPSRFI